MIRSRRSFWSSIVVLNDSKTDRRAACLLTVGVGSAVSEDTTSVILGHDWCRVIRYTRWVERGKVKYSACRW